MVKELNDDNFSEELKKDKTPVIIDLWAEWCGPCRMISPIFDEMSENPDYNGKIRFYKLNVDDNPKTASNFGVMSIPTILMLDSDGNEISRQIGAVPKEILSSFITENL